MNSNDQDMSTSTSTGSNGTLITFNGDRLPRRIFIFCLSFEIFLVLFDVIVNWGKLINIGAIRRLANIAREDGFATWFMVAQTLVAGLVLWLIFMVYRSRQESRGKVFAWGFLAGFFTYMSADDASKIHERLGTAFSKIVPEKGASSSDGFFGWLQSIFPSYDWQIAVLPLFVGIGFFMLFFLLREFHDRKNKILLFVAVGCMALAVVIDFFEGLDNSHAWKIERWIWEALDTRRYNVTHFAKALEEFLEMLSISLLLMLFTRHLIQTTNSSLAIDFSPKQT